MIRRGLIERVPSPGRAVRHQLTEKGRALRRAGDEIVDRVLRDSFGSLTPSEFAEFDELLSKVLSGSPQQPGG